MRLAPSILVAAYAAFSAPQATVREVPAELIVHNAAVYTGAAAQPTAEGIAIRGERFVAVGTSAEVLKWRGTSTRVVDAEGLTVVPGLQDAHGHVAGLGKPLQEIDLRDTPSFE